MNCTYGRSVRRASSPTLTTTSKYMDMLFSRVYMSVYNMMWLIKVNRFRRVYTPKSMAVLASWQEVTYQEGAHFIVLLMRLEVLVI